MMKVKGETQAIRLFGFATWNDWLIKDRCKLSGCSDLPLEMIDWWHLLTRHTGDDTFDEKWWLQVVRLLEPGALIQWWVKTDLKRYGRNKIQVTDATMYGLILFICCVCVKVLMYECLIVWMNVICMTAWTVGKCVWRVNSMKRDKTCKMGGGVPL